MAREQVLLLSLAAAVGLFAYSRTERGALALADAIDMTLPKGLRNRNPGNLRYIARNPWDGQIGDDGSGFGVYESMRLGVRASGRQLRKYFQRGQNTVRTILAGDERRRLAGWAPANENDTAAYVSAVSKALKVLPDTVLDVSRVLPDLAAAIFRHEVGAVAFAASTELTTANIREWVWL